MEEGKERLELELNGFVMDAVVNENKLTIKDVKTKLEELNWVNNIEDNNEKSFYIVIDNNCVYEITQTEEGKFEITGQGKDNGEPWPTISLEQLPTQGNANEKVRIKVTASVVQTKKTKKVEKIVNNTTKEEKEYVSGGVIFEVEENGTYEFEAIADNGKTRKAKITVNVESGEIIRILAEPTTPRNTIKAGTQNGIETGPIKVKITFGNINLNNSDKYQYKIGKDGEWQIATEKNVEIDVTENVIVVAKYYDGINSIGAQNYSIQNVDNEAPNAFTVTATSTANSITLSGTTTDITSTGYAGDSELTYKYSKDGKTWQDSNTITGLAQNTTYTVYIKAIDKAGNENIAMTDATTQKQLVTEITLNKTSTTIELGDSEKLVATIEPSNSNEKGVKWTSDNTEVATVAEDGTVTAHSTGTAIVTVTSQDGSNKSAKCTIKAIVKSGYYNIATGHNTNYYIDITDGKANSSGANAQLWSSSCGQVFEIIPVDDEYYKIRCAASEYVLDVYNAETKNGTNIQQFTWNSTKAQRWKFIYTGTNAEKKLYYIQSELGVMIDLSAGKVENGNNIQIWEKSNTFNQKWHLLPVTYKPVTNITLNKTSTTINIGATETLKATIQPSDANNKGIIWSSGNTEVATVSGGVITAKSIGTANITATAGDGSGKSATCTVTVKDASIKILVIGDTAYEQKGSKPYKDTIQKYFTNVEFNNSMTIDQLKSSNYDVYIDVANVWASLRPSVVNSLYAAGKNIITCSNDATTLDIIKDSISVTVGYTATKNIDNVLTNKMDNTLTEPSDSLQLVHFVDGTEKLYTTIYNGVSYDVMGCKKGTNGNRWLHCTLRQIPEKNLKDVINYVVKGTV